MIILRGYQERGITDIRAQFMRGVRRIAYVAPTGSGKTVLFIELVCRIRATRDQHVAIIVHRGELIDQTASALAAAGIEFGIVAAGYPEKDAPVLLCMAQTLANRLDRLVDVDFMIVDECHHATAATWLAIINAAPKARLLGVTATPERLSGEGLDEVFDTLVIGPTVKELIANRWLSPFVAFVPERLISLKGLRSVGGDYAAGDLAKRMNVRYVLEDALAEYCKHLDGRSAICFCTTIAHSRDVARFFRAAGIRAQHLDGDTPRAERQALIKALATGEVQIITNCSLISEGLDVPSVSGIILLRPTKSLALHLQQIGRALRPAPGKRAVILDHSGNCLRHGLPDLEHVWSLEGRAKTRGEALVRRCPECGAIIPIAARSCPECGADLRPASVKPTPTPDPLVELDPATAHERWLAQGSFKDVSQWAGDDETRLRQVAKARNYKPGWVWHRLRTSRQQLSASP
jgi:superfamily II DNA or RNA helicase